MSALKVDSSRLAEQFGRNALRRRRRAGLRQSEVAQSAGLHRVEISVLERGERLPRLDTILKLSAGLRVDPCQLLAGLHWYPGHRVEGQFHVEDEASLARRARRGAWRPGSPDL